MKIRFAYNRYAFSLAEVVVALGAIAIAIVAILGVFPLALRTGHSAQHQTRAPQIAQAILSSIVSQAQTQFDNIQLSIGSPPLSIDLTASSSPTTPTLYVDNDGNFTQDPTTAAYAIYLFANNSPPGFPSGAANQVTVRVTAPANAPAANQTFRDYVRIISKY